MKQITLLLLLVLISFGIKAQNTQSLEFLTIGAGAQQLALGEATTAIPTDGLNMWVNPASLSGVEDKTLSANYVRWFTDSEISSFSVVLKENKHTLGLGILSNSIGSIETRTTPGPATTLANVDYLALGASYAYQLPYVSLGITASYISEQYVTDNAGGYALGFGLYSSLWNDKIRLGASLNHLGEMDVLLTQRSELPTQIRFGIDADMISFTVPGDWSFPVLLSATADYTQFVEKVDRRLDRLDRGLNDLSLVQDSQSFFLGLRAFAGELISLNSGFRFLTESNRSWSVGLGLHQQAFQFDFAYIPFDVGFNNAYAIGMKYRF